jgi:hypothetical protein
VAAFAWPRTQANHIRSQQQRQRGWKLYSFHAPRSSALATATSARPTSSASKSRSSLPMLAHPNFARERCSLHAPDRTLRRCCCTSDPWRAMPPIRMNLVFGSDGCLCSRAIARLWGRANRRATLVVLTPPRNASGGCAIIPQFRVGAALPEEAGLARWRPIVREMAIL